MSKLTPWFTTLFFAATLASAPAQTSPSATATPDSAGVAALVEGTSTTTPDNVRYLKRPASLKNCVAKVDAIRGKPCDIIFIGDSITDGWLSKGKAIWEKTYVPRNALDFGVFGDKTQNVLWRLENVDLKGLHPKVAVILIGTNNTKNTPQEIADGVKAVIDRTQAAFPGVKIDSGQHHAEQTGAGHDDGGQPDDQEFRGQPDGLLAGSGAADAAGDHDQARRQTDTNWKGLGTDHLHPDASGYQIWADAMEPILGKLLQ